MQCDLTKFSLGVGLECHMANVVVKAFVKNFVCIYEIPDEILTDQGTEFLSRTFTDVCKLLKINKIKNSGYRPMTNCSLERSHKTLAEFLRHYVSES